MATFSIRNAADSVATSGASTWTLRLVTLTVWAALAGSVAYWVLRWPLPDVARDGIVTTVAGANEPTLVPAAASMGRALGATASPSASASTPALSSRLALVGVVRAGSHDGAALITVDGKPARSVRVGTEVEPGVYLLALEPRRASLGPDPRGAETASLELPRPKAP
jgi:general secretion pathway protein C